MIKILCVAIALFVLMTGCVPSVNKISGRNPDLFDKESDKVAGNSRPIGGTPTDLFVKEKKTVIKDVKEENDSGSLFNVEDERNYLFASTGPQSVGRYLEINVVSNRLDAAKAAAKPDAVKTPEEQKKEDLAKSQDEIQKELLGSLPDLNPTGAADDPALLKSFKMRIAHRYPNGDVLAMLSRRSTSDDQVKDVNIETRIPFNRLASGEPLTTRDLIDVKYHENSDGEITDRMSTGWEDEYSLRLSGFDEAKSKGAIDIADKRKKLEEATKKLETRMKSFGEERNQLSKQKEELTAKSEAQQEQVKVLEEKVKEQEGIIEDLKPQDKPGDKEK
jgi:hypothetical protein